MTDPDPEADLRRALRRHKAFATSLLVLMAALILVAMCAVAARLGRRPAAGRRQGRVRRRHRRLVRGDRAVPPPARHADPAHRHHPAPEGAARPRARPLRRQPCVHRRRGGRRAAPARPARHPAPLPGRPASARPAAQALAAHAAAHAGHASRTAAPAGSLARIIPRLLGGAGAGRVVARALRGLVEGGRHQEVFGFVLGQFKTLLASKEEALRAAIEERVREQGGRLVGWALGASIARRVLAMVNAELDKMSPDGSELRAAFDEWVRREIEPHGERSGARRRNRRRDPPRGGARDGPGLAVGRVVPAAPGAGGGRRAARTAAPSPSSKARSANLGVMLEADPAARARVHARGARPWSRSLLPAAQAQLADFIAQVVGRLGHRHDHRQAGAAGRQGPAIRADERHAGRLPGGRPALRRAPVLLRRRLAVNAVCPASVFMLDCSGRQASMPASPARSRKASKPHATTECEALARRPCSGTARRRTGDGEPPKRNRCITPRQPARI